MRGTFLLVPLVYGLNHYAVKVMQEICIDISSHFSKTVDEIDTAVLDYVVTVCSHAHETGPVFPGEAKIIHRGFDDPLMLARDSANEEEASANYRRVRDEIKPIVLDLSGSLKAPVDG